MMVPKITITLDDDVAQKLAELSKERQVGSIEVLANGVLSRALGIPFRVQAKALGLRPGFDLTCIATLLDEVEGPLRR